MASLPAEDAEDADAMLVLFSLLSRRTVTAEQLSAVLQKPVDETESILRRLGLDAVGMLKPTPETVRCRHPSYRLREHVVRNLGSAVNHHRRTVDEIDRQVNAAVQEIGQITSRMVQLLLDVNADRSSRILGDLVGRQTFSRHRRSSAGRGSAPDPVAGSRHASPGVGNRRSRR